MNKIVVRHLNVRKSVLAALLLLFSQMNVAQPAEPGLAQARFQDLSQRSFRSVLEKHGHKCEGFYNAKGYVTGRVEQEPLLAIACFISAIDRQGLSAIEQSLDEIAQLFLQHGLVDPLNALLREAQDAGRRADQARLRFWLARHALETENWAQAHAHKMQITARYSLTADQQSYLTLMGGVLLQLGRQHREAIKLYENFPEDSRFYPVARANLALAYISQNWWTEAYQEIDQLLALPLEKEFHNRLRIVKGLSQLQQGFYRNARNTFRSMDRDSRYTDKAWLGIGLTALHLNDHAGALNAFERIQATSGESMQERVLLVAYTYERMGEIVLAEASYTEAIAHYQNQINRYDARLAGLTEGALPDDLSATFDNSLGLPVFLDHQGDLSTPLPLRQYLLLENLSEYIDDDTLRNELTDLQSVQRQFLAEQLADDYRRRQEHVQSYLSQSQYGLATIYDH